MIPLIDTHQHLIYPARQSYPWTGGAPALAGRDFSLGEYRGLTAGQGIDGTIFMECDASDYRAEARMIAGIAQDPESGILGLIASCRPEEEAGFAEWLDEGPGLGVVGYRRILHEAEDGLSQSPTFRANLREIGRRGLPFDMVVLARQLPVALDLARACEGTTFVLDHCGNPDIAGGDLTGWRAGITALAALPHVHAKISGVLTQCPPGQATFDTVRPAIEHVIGAFGPERCLWGSDWPVVNLRADLPGWIGVTRALLDTLSEAEAGAIAQGTARRVYGIAAA